MRINQKMLNFYYELKNYSDSKVKVLVCLTKYDDKEKIKKRYFELFNEKINDCVEFQEHTEINSLGTNINFENSSFDELYNVDNEKNKTLMDFFAKEIDEKFKDNKKTVIMFRNKEK
jgi:hypothetical protein